MCILKRTHADSNERRQRKLRIDQKSGAVAAERRMSQRDLLLDGDSPLRVELQLQPSVSALDRAHTLHNTQSAVCLCE